MTWHLLWDIARTVLAIYAGLIVVLAIHLFGLVRADLADDRRARKFTAHVDAALDVSK